MAAATPTSSGVFLDQPASSYIRDLSLLETLEAQPFTVESAAQFCDGALIISPITLRPRFNPNATEPKQSRVTFVGNRRPPATNTILRRVAPRDPRAAHVTRLH